MKWQEVKDLFRESVGDVSYVELFNDESDKPRGCGILEFATEELAKKAVEKMHRTEYRGRKLVVKEDFDTERDRFGRIVRGGGGGGGGGGGRDRDRHSLDRGRDRGSSMGGGGGGYGNTYGLSPQFLESLGIDGPLHTRLFVANLVYTVDEKKLREVFRLAGRVVSVELNRDKEGKSRGHAVIDFDHPVEAVQAISMFNDQYLFERKMTVRFDKTPGPTPEEMAQLPSRLPEGLAGVGMGLGSGGNPLTEVAKNLPSSTSGSQSSNMNTSGGGGGGGTGGALANLNMSELTNVANTLALARQMTMGLNNMGGGGGGAPGGGMNNANNGMGGGMGGGNNMNNMGNTGMNMGNAGMNNMGMGSGMGGGPVGGGMMSGGGGGAGNSMMSDMKPNMNTGGYNSGQMQDIKPSMNVGGYGGGASRNTMDSMGGASGSAMGGRPAASDTIIVRNLPVDCNWQVLREGFSHCGEIKYAEMKERGTGLIRFSDERSAERAMCKFHEFFGFQLISKSLFFSCSHDEQTDDRRTRHRRSPVLITEQSESRRPPIQ